MGHWGREPGRTLRAAVVRTRHTDVLGDRLAVMADAGVVDAAARLGITKDAPGSSDCAAQQRARGLPATAGDPEAHGVHQRQRSACDGGHSLAGLNAYPVANIAAPEAPLFVEHRAVDRVEFRPRVFVFADLLVLAAVARRLGFMAPAPPEDARDQRIALIHEMRLHVLDRGPTGEPTLRDVDPDHVLDASQAVAPSQVAEHLAIVAGVDAVHTDETLASAAQPAERHEEKSDAR